MVIKIECDKRIKKVNIEFYDGFETEHDEIQTIKSESQHVQHAQQIKKPQKQRSNEKVLNTSDDFITEVNQEIIEKPEVVFTEREPLVAQEMQKLEF